MGEGIWSYKLQASFLQQSKFQLLLQDALLKYKINNFEVTGGRFVLNFSLQRKQHDYTIPLHEGAGVVNALVSGAETMARHIGVELKFSGNKTGSFSLVSLTGTGLTMFQIKRIFFT